MNENNVRNYIGEVLKNMPVDWLKLTTHRLDIYNEELAKTEFLNQFETLFQKNNSEPEALRSLPTAFDYIRLGHPLSSVLEWTIAKLNKLEPENVISFSSTTVPILAVLRKNLLDQKKTRIVYTEKLPDIFDEEIIRKVYGYSFETLQIKENGEIPKFNGSTIFVSQEEKISHVNLSSNPDFYLSMLSDRGSILLVNTGQESYIPEIQHVRRRETISMTPADSYAVLEEVLGKLSSEDRKDDLTKNEGLVSESLKEITDTNSKALLASSGLSMQYAIMMGLIHHALERHKGKDIKFIVPPNCYGGTNDQARRVAACLENVEVLDLPVDGENDMVQSTGRVLDQVASQDAVPYIIAEIPTNPRVEVPDLNALKEVLSKERQTASGEPAIAPVFILDQTFCPNVQFLSQEGILSDVKTISYVSGSKFPSGGRCTAGYCVANQKAESLLDKIGLHLRICDNQATALQTKILAEQLPSMNRRINEAYLNTREFVNFIHDALPEAKINFVSEELAQEGFTPSVFSLDLPTKGKTEEERESYKRALNKKLIDLMITVIPNESKYCVSYGQLKGCYWTIPATSTQGTTKEGDKDYIVRVSLSPNLDLQLHKKVFLDFVKDM